MKGGGGVVGGPVYPADVGCITLDQLEQLSSNLHAKGYKQ